jgi:MoxR-like ATPase
MLVPHTIRGDRDEDQKQTRRPCHDRAHHIVLIALLAEGHLLVEGAPGLAKTTAIKELAARIEGNFQRVQFTPDLLPGDLTGTDIYRPETGEFQFQSGPLFHNLVLADEVNRARPRCNPPCSRPWASARSPSAGAPIRCRTRFWSWRRRTRSSRRAPIRCPRPSLTAS